MIGNKAKRGKGRPKGLGKTPGSGRKAGTPNVLPTKRLLQETISEAFARLNFDPLEKLVTSIELLEPAEKVRTILMLLPYLYAPAKPQEATPSNPFLALTSIDKATLIAAASAPASSKDETQ